MYYALLIASISSVQANAETVLMFNQPRDTSVAQSACRWAEDEIKNDQYLTKSSQCAESELCQQAVEVSAACKVNGAANEVQRFHSQLLTEFARNRDCNFSIMRLTGGNSAAETANDYKAFKAASQELNLGFKPGLPKQMWALWPRQNGEIDTGKTVLEGEGDATQVARDVCAIVAGRGARILN